MLTLGVVVPLALATLAALVWLWPSASPLAPQEYAAQEFTGTVQAVQAAPCSVQMPDEVNGCGTATIVLDEASRLVEAELPNGSGAPLIQVGDDVVVVLSATPDGEFYAIVDHQRGLQLLILAAVFVIALVAFGRWHGISSLVGLAVTFAVLMLFVIPAILSGSPPFLVAVIGASVIILCVLYLTHGISATTNIAVLGTIASFTLTGVLSAVAVAALKLSGVTDDVSMAVEMTFQVDMQGLLLAGIVIGSLGVLDDVTVTQSVTVTELARANPQYDSRELYRAGSRVGRSHIASVVNTIVLAYAGSSLPLFVLVVGSNNSWGDVATTQFLAQEIVRSAVATLGLIAAVPITTGLASLALRRG